MFLQIPSKLDECIEQIQEQYGNNCNENPRNINFIQTGFPELDKKIKGIPCGHVTVISSEALHGKTSLALGIALHAALRKGLATVIVDLQRKSCKVAMRLIALLSEIPIPKLMMGNISDDEWGKLLAALGELNDAPISIKDDEPVSIEVLIGELEAMHRKNRIGLVVIDGLDFEKTEQPGIQDSRKDSMVKLYCFASDFRLAVIVTTQLNQALHHSRNGIPSRRDIPFDIADMAETVMVPYSHDQDLSVREKSKKSGVAVYRRGNKPVFVPLKLDTDTGLFYEGNEEQKADSVNKGNAEQALHRVVGKANSQRRKNMRQMTLATNGFEKHRKQTRNAEFLSRMDRLVPWAELCMAIEPFYPKAGNSGSPIDLELMLRMHFIAHWFNLTDEACEDALYDVITFRDFCAIDLGRQCVPDATSLLNFRHLLEEHKLEAVIFAKVGELLQANHM